MDDDGKDLVVQCCVCLECFDEEGDRRPVIRSCGHSCCVGCSKKIASNKCPVCNVTVTPKKGKEKTVINYQLIEQIRNQKEMVKRFAKMEKDYIENECRVNDLKTKASQAEKYEKAFKCRECKFPMKEGFFCLSCLRQTVDTIESYSDEQLTEFTSNVICGGCLKKHEKKGHKTAELEDIKKKQHKTKFQTTVCDKLERIESGFDQIKGVFEKVGDKMQRMHEAVSCACTSLPLDQTNNMLRMEKELTGNLTVMASSLKKLVNESYRFQMHVDEVIESAENLSSLSSLCSTSIGVKQEPVEIVDDFGPAFNQLFPSPSILPSNGRKPNFVQDRLPSATTFSFVSLMLYLLLLINPLVLSFPVIFAPLSPPQDPLSKKLKETIVVEIDELATSTNVIAINSKSGVAGSFFQGDIFLTPEQEEEIKAGTRRRRQAISLARKWANNTLNYYFDSGIEEKKKDAVRIAASHLQSYTCIDFHENATAFDRVKVVNGSGCSSFVGMIGGEQLLSLGTACDHSGTAAHELMHAIGIEHTHDRFDRDNFILINTEAVNLLYLLSFLIIDPFRMVALVPYDYGSALHYPANAFTSGKNMSIVAKDTNYTYTMGSGLVSFYDLVAINTFYKCHEQFCAQSQTKCLNGGMPNPRDCSICYCPSGYGGPNCGERPPGCGQTLTATGDWQSVTMTLGTEGDNSFKNNYEFCNYWIQAPPGKRVESRIMSMKSTICSYGCFFNGVEIKIDVNTQPTGARFCCNEFVNRTWTSEQNPMPIIHYNSYSQSQFALEYRFVDAPCREDHPLCESTPDFCTEDAYPVYYRRYYCPKKCQLC